MGREFTGTSRFHVEAQLGAGGFGDVYRVFDGKRRQSVALKLLRRVDADSIYRFKREFRALTGIVHPNLVQLYELLCEDEQWFFTMELVEGVDLLEHIRVVGPADAKTTVQDFPIGQDPSRGDIVSPLGTETQAADADPVAVDTTPVTLAILCAAFTQMVAGLQTLHAAGCLHRDIKPSNAIVTREGRVVLLDFGLIKAIKSGRLDCDSLDTGVMGTPAYMSPEQADGEPLCEASDWYSLGVVLYEALAGRRPFNIRNPIDAYRIPRSQRPTPPSEFAPGVPEHLDALCRAMLALDPAVRPTGVQILARLGTVAADAPHSATAGAPTSDAPLIGRERQLAVMEKAFRQSRAGKLVKLFVHGPSGMGKTMLIEGFLGRLVEQESLVLLAGRCYHQESVPFKLWDGVVDSLTRHLLSLPNTKAAALLPTHVVPLVRIFPVLLRVQAFAEACREQIEPCDPKLLRKRAFAAFRDLLYRLSQRGPLVVFVDDLQWGDVDGSALLREVFRGPDAPSLLFIGAYRSEEASIGPWLTELLAREPTDDTWLQHELEVDALSVEDAAELARSLLSHSAGDGARAAAIADESEGIPYYVAELARFALENTEKPETVQAGSSAVQLDAMLRRRIAQLPDGARRFLEVVAIAGRPTELSVASAAAGASVKSQDLPLLLGKNLVRRHGESAVTFYHDRVRESALAELCVERRKAHHGSLARALEATGRTDFEALAQHLYESGERERALGFQVRAADDAFSKLAYDHAARLIRSAFDHHEIPQELVQPLQLQLGHSLSLLGRGLEAASAFLEAAQGLSVEAALEPRRLAARELLLSGRNPEHGEIIPGVLRAAGVVLPRYHAGGKLLYLCRRLRLRLRGLNFRERAAEEIPAPLLKRIDTCLFVANALSLRNDGLGWRDFSTRALLLALKAGEPGRVAVCLAWEGGVLSRVGATRRSQKVGHQARTLALKHGARPEVMSRVVNMEAFSVWWSQGDFRKLLELSQEIFQWIERCPAIRNSMLLSCARALSAIARCNLGQIKDLGKDLIQNIWDARDRDDLLGEFFIACATPLNVTMLADDRPEALRSEKELSLLRTEAVADAWSRYFKLLFITDLGLYTETAQEAWQSFETEWPALLKQFIFRIPVAKNGARFARARCALGAAQASHGSERNSRIQAALRMARRLSRGRVSFSQAAADLVLAGVASLEGRADLAIPRLERAEAAFEAVGMELHSAICRRRRGQLVGGEEGKAALNAADFWMQAEGIRYPEKMAQVFSPGHWGDS